jgi:hypothetical protein
MIQLDVPKDGPSGDAGEQGVPALSVPLAGQLASCKRRPSSLEISAEGGFNE